MPIKTVSAAEAAELQRQGYTYVDVRSSAEFESGRPAGSVNLPVMERSMLGMTPNKDFVGVWKAAFPADAKLVVGCHTGNRSMRAIEIMAAEGYADLVLAGEGWVGWANAGLPAENGAAPGRDWPSMKAKKS